jgi:glycosyltransferase involved in cell wall biosynthesis
LGVPEVFDYLDASPLHVERHYVRRATRVISVSHHLHDQLVQRYGRESRVVPNGLHLDRFVSPDANRARQKWQLTGRTVVSLIGLTCSSRLYFLDALARVARDRRDILFLGAGAGVMADRIRVRCEELGLETRMTGWVDPSEVADLFAASDVGLYPGDDTPYFDGACPLKVLEYAAARVPTVVNRCAELVRMGFGSVLVRPATVEGFEDGLRAALSVPPASFPDMGRYDWSRVAAEFAEEVDAAIGGRAKGSGT